MTNTNENDLVGELKKTPMQGSVDVDVSDDGLIAKITLFTPQDEKPLAEADLLAALSQKGVVKNIRNDYVKRLVRYPVYEKPFKIAEGKPPSNGKNGELICHFNTDNSLVPKVLEDGSTDYKNIGFVNSAKEGDILCDIIHAEKGEDGYTVTGKVLKAESNVKEIPAPNGANTKISEDGSHLLAMCDGHVSLKDGKVQIKKVMNVDQVDKATGNILFSGDVNVGNDVRDGFSIRAGGSITVKGVVEGATLVAGRDIIVSKGVHGKDSTLSAGGSVKTGYIEMAQVKAKEGIFADTVLNAELICEGKVSLTGRKGCLIGGVCKAFQIEATEIGNEANILTEIYIVDPTLSDGGKKETLDKIAACTENLEQFAEALKASSQSNVDSEQKQANIAKLMVVKRTNEAELRELNAKLQEISEIEIEYNGRITIHGCMHHNVSLDVEGVILKNSYLRPASTLYRKKDKIFFSSYTG